MTPGGRRWTAARRAAGADGPRILPSFLRPVKRKVPPVEVPMTRATSPSAFGREFLHQLQEVLARRSLRARRRNSGAGLVGSARSRYSQTMSIARTASSRLLTLPDSGRAGRPRAPAPPRASPASPASAWRRPRARHHAAAGRQHGHAAAAGREPPPSRRSRSSLQLGRPAPAARGRIAQRRRPIRRRRAASARSA